MVCCSGIWSAPGAAPPAAAEFATNPTQFDCLGSARSSVNYLLVLVDCGMLQVTKCSVHAQQYEATAVWG